MDNKLVALIISILLPPLAVYAKRGAGKDLVINLLLCILMWVPGVLHAIWLTVL
ncbi:YqaE/Pmp3 family membrane protein [Pseudohalioglobus sediminis]|uniref:YqaE/Pmp3 family membrane protein n=1 Tax=Pseudohalioglobus sediminis TaxID=2606449 RepID=A0A5B0X2E7_9GAMM|nr:YqaE/Pmp3 family membrane protein [Pseudohalioglobus sediminis]KAA1193382.1 YqaE/Pmp3 family membrane protein [Pseudohalioglobus sediminis]